MPRFSIITPTRQRNLFGFNMLRLWAVQLAQQACQDFEAILVVDTLDDVAKAMKVLEQGDRFARDIGLNPVCATKAIVTYPTPRTKPRPQHIAVADALAAGVSVASGDILVRFDDDDLYGVGYLSAVDKFYRDNPTYPAIVHGYCPWYSVKERAYRAVCGTWGTVQSVKRDEAKRLEAWKVNPNFDVDGCGEDYLFAMSCFKAGFCFVTQLCLDAVEHLTYMRYGTSHAWADGDKTEFDTPDPDGEWLASRIGYRLAEEIFSFVHQEERLCTPA